MRSCGIVRGGRPRPPVLALEGHGFSRAANTPYSCHSEASVAARLRGKDE